LDLERGDVIASGAQTRRNKNAAPVIESAARRFVFCLLLTDSRFGYTLQATFTPILSTTH
jgi:hypothetical protein